MDQKDIEKILQKAGNAVEKLPEHLQGKAFELAVKMLSGEAKESSGADSAATLPKAHAHLGSSELAEVTDLLPFCKRNPDRYLIFMRDLESAAEEADSAAIIQRFRKYKQDVPKLPSRDLGEMIAKGLVEQLGRGRQATFALKRKGRERLAEMEAAFNAQ